MLSFMRNKLVSVSRQRSDVLIADGILDDDLYSIRIKVTIRLSDLEITAIEGFWNRWTTPECWRAIEPLQAAVGMRMEKGLGAKISKTIGRKACRHYANILLECCHSAKEAATLIKTGDEIGEKSAPVAEKSTAEGQPAEEETPPLVNIKEGPGGKKEGADKGAQKKVNRGIALDLHTHTYPASPCSSAAVDNIIEEAKRIGLDGICLTDHNFVWNLKKVEDLRQKHGFLVLRGNEITTDQGDMIIFGLEKDIQGVIKLQDLRQEVLRAGGFMIVAHPFRGFLVFGVGQLGLTPEKAMERPLFRFVDAVEILNSKVTEKENNFAAKVAARLQMPVTGGSDAHDISEVGIYATQFSDTIKDEKQLVRALKSGNYSPITFRRDWAEEI